MLTQSHTHEYLELRHAQFDILFAQMIQINARIRMLGPHAAALLRARLALFRRECHVAKKILLCAERGRAADWEQTKKTLDLACGRLKRLSAELNYQMPCADDIAPDVLQISLPGLPNLDPTVLTSRTAENKVFNIQ